MKKIGCTLSVLLVLIMPTLVYAEDDQAHEIEFSESPHYKYLFFVKYTNKSKVAHCIRADDFEFRALGNFLGIQNEKGESLRYIGYNSAPREIMYPDAYKIVLPGTTAEAGFYINKFYKMKGKSFSASYAFPVIGCTVVLDRYIKMPPPSSINSSIQRYGEFDLESFKESYPDWYKEGFLAVSNKLEFKKK